jgi:hypothetical protein
MINSYEKINIQSFPNKTLSKKQKDTNRFNLFLLPNEFKIKNNPKKKQKTNSLTKFLSHKNNIMKELYKSKNSRNNNIKHNYIKNKRCHSTIFNGNNDSSNYKLNTVNKDNDFDIFSDRKINYSIFINISNIERKPYLMTSFNLNKNRKDLLYIPIYSKKKLSRSRSSLNICNHRYKIDDNTNITNISSDNKSKDSSMAHKNKNYKDNIIYHKIKYILNNNKSKMYLIIMLQSFIRRFLIRNKIYKILTMFYKIEASIRHINKYKEMILQKRKYKIMRLFMENMKKNFRKKYFVDKEQIELLNELKKRNVHCFNEFKSFVIWCINNNIDGI